MTQSAVCYAGAVGGPPECLQCPKLQQCLHRTSRGTDIMTRSVMGQAKIKKEKKNKKDNEREAAVLETIFTNHVSDKELISRIYKEFSKFDNRETIRNSQNI